MVFKHRSSFEPHAGQCYFRTTLILILGYGVAYGLLTYVWLDRLWIVSLLGYIFGLWLGYRLIANSARLQQPTTCDIKHVTVLAGYICIIGVSVAVTMVWQNFDNFFVILLAMLVQVVIQYWLTIDLAILTMILLVNLWGATPIY
jgi:hypothetical protein